MDFNIDYPMDFPMDFPMDVPTDFPMDFLAYFREAWPDPFFGDLCSFRYCAGMDLQRGVRPMSDTKNPRFLRKKSRI